MQPLRNAGGFVSVAFQDGREALRGHGRNVAILPFVNFPKKKIKTNTTNLNIQINAEYAYQVKIDLAHPHGSPRWLNGILSISIVGANGPITDKTLTR